MCAPSAPPPPDYRGAAAEQGRANIEAARTTSMLNNPNIVNPYGSTSYQSSNVFDQAGYDTAMAKYQNDLAAYQNAQQADNQALTQAQEAYDSRDNRGIGRRPTTIAPSSNLPNPVAPDRANFTTLGRETMTQTLAPEQQALFEKSNQVKGLLADLGIQAAGTVGDTFKQQMDFSGIPELPTGTGTRDAAYNSMMARVNEDIARQRDQKNSELIAAGIRPGTKAYADAQFAIDRQLNDARQQAILGSGQEAQREFGMGMDARKQAIAELLAKRQNPLNEISALMSGSQVTNPFAGGIGYQAGQPVAAAPIMQGAQQQGQWDMNNYAQQVGANNAMMSGLFGLGAGYLAGGPAWIK